MLLILLNGQQESSRALLPSILFQTSEDEFPCSLPPNYRDAGQILPS